MRIVIAEDTVLLRGAPDIALAKEARRGYSLIVLGSHGRNFAATVLLGSTTERVIARSSIPVLTVPTRAAARAR